MQFEGVAEWLTLVNRFQLTVIQDQEQYETAKTIYAELNEQASMNECESIYFVELHRLIREYEKSEGKFS